jgi:hypothetical protein
MSTNVNSDPPDDILRKEIGRGHGHQMRSLKSPKDKMRIYVLEIRDMTADWTESGLNV